MARRNLPGRCDGSVLLTQPGKRFPEVIVGWVVHLSFEAKGFVKAMTSDSLPFDQGPLNRAIYSEEIGKMIVTKRSCTLLSLFLLLAVNACASPNSPQTSSSARSTSEVNCISSTPHPICKASFANNPSGTLVSGSISTGTAIFEGRKVNYTCYPGNSDRQQTRSCSW